MSTAILSFVNVVKDIKNKLNEEPQKIRDLKNFFVKAQKFEEASLIREVEKALQELLEKINAAQSKMLL